MKTVKFVPQRHTLKLKKKLPRWSSFQPKLCPKHKVTLLVMTLTLIQLRILMSDPSAIEMMTCLRLGKLNIEVWFLKSENLLME